MLFLTVPTRGDHPELLARLVEESGLTPDRVVVVRTDPRAVLPDGVTVVEDTGPLNIHRWWNRGIDACVAEGASHVAVVNDDIITTAEGLAALERALDVTGATIASPGVERRIVRGRRPRGRTLVGSLWVLNAGHGLRPSESYRWFFGDDDLDIRARSQFRGVATTPVDFEHVHPGEATSGSPVLLQLAAGDELTFRRQHPLDYLYRKGRDRTQGRTGKFVGRQVARIASVGR